MYEEPADHKLVNSLMVLFSNFRMNRLCSSVAWGVFVLYSSNTRRVALPAVHLCLQRRTVTLNTRALTETDSERCFLLAK
jgi:hypothetical protein